MKKALLNTARLAVVVAASLFAAPVARGAKNAEAAPTSVPFGEARFGVNLAVAEFGGHAIPGTYGVHYIYPEPKVLDYYRAKGRTLIRFPFLWERMQRSLNSPLDATELAHLQEFLRAAGQRQMHVILDVHNYGRYKFAGEEGEAQIIGSERVPYAAFADLWSRLVTAVKDDPAVYAYGLMNEPHGMGDAMRWPLAAQAAIDAIRKLDTRTPIMVCGDQFGSAGDWRKGSNETIHEKVHDPQNNLIFEAHCYFDKNLSGTYKKTYEEEGGSPNVGIERVRPFVEWCRDKGVRGFVGEYGVPDNDTRWLVAMDRFLAYLQANKISATYWAAGPWWGPYPLSIEPSDARAAAKEGTAQDGAAKDGVAAQPVDRPQMLVLRQYPG
ncbi:MAG: glycoside hydrolase family 5 protein [Armatimonadota bacterium]|nr:glycoside hydrolase family 5 protein [Armatimonadota bacterium]